VITTTNALVQARPSESRYCRSELSSRARARGRPRRADALSSPANAYRAPERCASRASSRLRGGIVDLVAAGESTTAAARFFRLELETDPPSSTRSRNSPPEPRIALRFFPPAKRPSIRIDQPLSLWIRAAFGR
jgi:hypothetical protein